MNKQLERIASCLLNLVTLNYINCVERATQHKMTSFDRDVIFIKYATFEDFEKEFRMRDWVPIDGYISLQSHDAYLHAGIYRFGSVGYLMSSYGLVKAQRLIKNTVVRLTSKPVLP